MTPPTPPPPGPIGPYLNGVFPPTTPGENGSWELEDPLPGISFYGPVRIVPFGDRTEEVLVLGLKGEVWWVSLREQRSKLVLDIRDRTFALGDAGAVGIALHPHFGDQSYPDQQQLFLYYRTNPDLTQWDEKGYNRLSRFQWDTEEERFLEETEEILIQQYDRHTWHNGGGMFFGPDGFLYLAVGDEGLEEFQEDSNQHIDKGLFGGILRLDVDNDPSRSHPIRRQPQANATPPAGWPPTFSQGYSIPNDNPWLSPDGSTLEEFYAIGARSPYAISYDPNSGLIWLADVGSDQREEITQVRKGDNLQWPYQEGLVASTTHSKPTNLIGTERPPYFEYDRDLGSCIMGGEIYHGSDFPELVGKYLFADFISNRVMALSNTSEQSVPEVEVLIGSLENQTVRIPSGAGITGVFALPDGQVLVSIIGNRNEAVPGKIFRLKRRTTVPDPPAKLSELGVFVELETLTPITGIIPYRTNSPLWSDRALKQRWLAVPNDGSYDTPAEQVIFKNRDSWSFPAGTVFIKHFELPLTTAADGPTQRLETRFFVLGEEGRAYGLTYKWNEEGTEAFLQGGGSSKTFDIVDEQGNFQFTQAWDFPSREQCMSCHTAQANFVLGVNTHQLNGDYTYPHDGRSRNQLTYLNEQGLFQRNIGAPAQYKKAYPIEDEMVDLELRIRSYLDANCASCHRLGGLATVNMDLRFNTPLSLTNIINYPTNSHSSDRNRVLVKPGAHAQSELWVRDASNGEERMPPISHNLIDEVYVEKLAEWIDGLSEDAGVLHQNLLFPNPSNGWISIRIRDDWQGPFRYTIYSLDGRLIEQIQSERLSQHLDFTFLPRGTYVLKIEAQGQQQVERFVIQ